jgi:hypothetical protein
MLNATPLLRAFAARRLHTLARQDAAATQLRTLLALLHQARSTQFGVAHGFAGLRDVAGYQRRVKLRRWEEFWRDWWSAPFPRLRDVTWPGTIPCFANTSGTSGAATKRIPVSYAMLRANRRAALQVLVHHVAERPDSRLLAGRSFLLGGSTKLERLAPGIVAGDLSGLAAATVPWWAQRRIFPPTSLALIADWHRKIDTLAPLSLAAHVTSISGTTSWLLLFLERLRQLRPGAGLRALYPGLELLVHGGVSFAPYRAGFAPWLEGSGVTTREVYPASEGFIAVADRGEGEGLRLLLDNGLFFEFVRPDALESENPDRRWIADAELGVEYALVLSSNAGLWSYVLGDTVTLTGRDPPRLTVTGRVGWSLSVAGEHLVGQELDAGISAATAAVGAQLVDYAAAARAPDAADPRGGHQFFVELASAPPDCAGAFADALDAALARENADYAAHRQGDFGLRPPAIVLLPPGGFASWMQTRGKLGGQNKVPRVISDPALLESLRRVADPR